MTSNLSLKSSLLIIGIVVIIILRFFLPKNLPISSSPLPASVILSITPPEETRLGIPARFKIPSINVDTNIEQVGLTSDGAMDVPREPQDVAWFDLGPRPGEVGSAVIAGHSGYKDNKPAIFDNLNKLQKGDKIYVEDESGTTTVFVVREFHNYDPKADASSVFSSDDGGIHLNLITCTGAWNEAERTHSDRLVVFADKE